jgi:hypothetical protein
LANWSPNYLSVRFMASSRHPKGDLVRLGVSRSAKAQPTSVLAGQPLTLTLTVAVYMPTAVARHCRRPSAKAEGDIANDLSANIEARCGSPG